MASDRTKHARRDDEEEPLTLPSAMRRRFHEEARQRYANVLASGTAIDWASMRRYMEQRMAGLPAERPIARRFLR